MKNHLNNPTINKYVQELKFLNYKQDRLTGDGNVSTLLFLFGFLKQYGVVAQTKLIDPLSKISKEREQKCFHQQRESKREIKFPLFIVSCPYYQGRLAQHTMHTLEVARFDVAVLALYFNKAEARDKFCRAIQYFCKFINNGQPGIAYDIEKSSSLARKAFRIFKVISFSFILSIHPSDLQSRADSSRMNKGQLTSNFYIFFFCIFV